MRKIRLTPDQLVFLSKLYALWEQYHKDMVGLRYEVSFESFMHWIYRHYLTK